MSFDLLNPLIDWKHVLKDEVLFSYFVVYIRKTYSVTEEKAFLFASYWCSNSDFRKYFAFVFNVLINLVTSDSDNKEGN